MKYFTVLVMLLVLSLIFHNEVIAGTGTGLLLWYQTLIPALLPFILITNALSETNSYEAAAVKFRNTVQNIYVWIAIILGNLCGYPIGGKIINDFTDKGYLTPDRSNHLLALSSQASPMFLIGYVYPHILEQAIPLPVFLLLIYAPILPYYFIKKHIIAGEYPQKTEPSGHAKAPNVSNTFLQAVRIMVIIGIYVMLFSILLEICIPRITYLPASCALAFLEITTGLKLLKTLPLPPVLSISLIMTLSAFGGLCSAYQIKGVLTYPHASIKKYLLDKMLLSAGTFLLTYIYLSFF